MRPKLYKFKRYLITIFYYGFFTVIVHYSVNKHYNTSYCHYRLYSKTTPIWPERCAPFPLCMTIDFKKRANCNEQSENTKYPCQQLHGGIARRLLHTRAYTSDPARDPCGYYRGEAINVTLLLRVEEVQVEREEGVGYEV